MSWLALLMFVTIIAVLMAGFPVAFTLAGVALLFAGVGTLFGVFDPILAALPSRIFGIMNNQTLLAVPLFVFMGAMLERAKIAEDLLETMSDLFGKRPGGLAVSVIVVGMLLAASTGIVGATVVTMGMLSLPTMIKRGYDPGVSTGVICASGTLGQIIPPSIVLVLLGDQLSSAYQQAQLKQGIFAPETLSVGDLFMGAVIPGVILVSLYLLYIIWLAYFNPDKVPVDDSTSAVSLANVLKALLPPLLLIMVVLGSIIAGLATPTEAASVGAVGALLLAVVKKQFDLSRLREVMDSTLRITCMVFMILIGATLFSLVFRGFGGDDAVHQMLTHLPGGVVTAVIIVMLIMFVLGFILDFIEITFVVVPIVGPILLSMGLDPVWLGIMIAINLQTSFLTPPFGFALFYLRGVAPDEIKTGAIYKGVMPFIAIQVLVLLLLALWPELATWLPDRLNA